ncbi:type II toxin-antitoxin system VapC family toxin [Hydrogenophaga sp. BPS33]|uniref:type II toxin-antitoxin system VapC family toxin n=1 Tax=Hydrogenophaga sp. BPS33 TaxID=2651974 RepID=UPI00131FDA32|nr:PIN domain-containing protein [Hydrogenophaga sp. BPS33]QHE84103.1 PIN domain nuclease [Hydrogenophaga sp. BPS33]
MILVDSSVWIDYFRGTSNAQTQQLDQWLDEKVHEVGVADLIVFEVLRGFRVDRAFNDAQAFFGELQTVEIGGMDNVLHATKLNRRLRAMGRTVRSPVDVLLASYCMTHGHLLLHRDADFESLKTLGGLKTWPH